MPELPRLDKLVVLSANALHRVLVRDGVLYGDAWAGVI
jgi:hypothetical protein